MRMRREVVIVAIAVLRLYAGRGHEDGFNQRQNRRVITGGVRNVVRLRERRDRHEGHAEAQLIEVSAGSREWTSGRKAWAKLRCRGFADGALRTTTGLLAGRGIGEISALTGVDAVWIGGMVPLRPRRSYVIVRAAVLVIGNENDAVLPERAVANGIHYLRNKGLAALNVGGRMLVVFGLESTEQAKVGINKGDLRQRAHAGNTCNLGEEQLQGQKVRIRRSDQSDGAESAALWEVLEVVGPGDLVCFHQIKNGSGDRLVSGGTGRRADFRGGEVAEG